MSAVEEIEAAIAELTRTKAILGLMGVGENPAHLYARVEEDDDGDGGRITVGIDLTGVDSDAEINEALVTLHATIDAQLAILTDWHDRYAGKVAADYVPASPSNVNPLALARAINGVTNG